MMIQAPKALQQVSRINVLSLTFLRYLIVKDRPIGFQQLHLEWSLCNVSDDWDISDVSLRQLLKTMVNSDLIAEIEGEHELLYVISPTGYQLVSDFLAIDQNILNQKWRI
jgi:hypothetical protein